MPAPPVLAPMPMPGAAPGAAAPMPGAGPPGSVPAPGGMAPPGLPDLQAVGRAAMAEVLQGTAAAAAARDRLPDLIEQADLARVAAGQVAGAPAGQVQAAPPPAPVTTTVPAEAQLVPAAGMAPAPGVWRGPPPAWQPQQPGWQGPPPAWQRQPAPQPAKRLDRSSRPGAEPVLRNRDRGQRIGDALYPFVRWLRESRAGWVGVIALFGITLPIMLLRQDFDVRLRLVIGFFSFIFWIQFLSELIPG